MEYTRLGSSGLKISRVVMGMMSFGEGDSGSGSSSSDRSWRPTRSCVASSVRRPLTSRWLGCYINRR
jgi:aryl-alcohol dehydrogenase-like predicted oxidoreductase